MESMDVALHEPGSIARQERATHQPPTVRERLQTRFSRRRLDRELADGCAPAGSPIHTLRAIELSDPSVRREVAAQLRHVVADAGQLYEVLHPVRLRRSTVLVSLRRGEVMRWREGLLGLADRLEDPVVSPAGVARARVVLSDGAGPLYNVYPARSLGETIWWIADGLDADPESPPEVPSPAARPERALDR
jgi:hypothetical protein